MPKLFTFRASLAFILLLIAAGALTISVRAGVQDVDDAQFIPVAMFAATLSFLLGRGRWSARGASVLIIASGIFVSYIEAARLVGPLVALWRSLPRIDSHILIQVLRGQAIDLSQLQAGFSTLLQQSNAFLVNILDELHAAARSSDAAMPSVREVIWDGPIVLLAGWMGWWLARRDSALVALTPSIALQAYILNATGARPISLQLSLFALVFLLGIARPWTVRAIFAQTSERTLRETYSTLLIFSFALALVSGFVPANFFKDAAKKLANPDKLNQTLGLDNPKLYAYRPTSAGLPREELVGAKPSQLQTVVFTVKTGELPAVSGKEAAAEPVPQHYWRWLTYDIYSGAGWNTTPVTTQEQPANVELFPIYAEGHRIIHQQVTKASAQDSHLYWTGSLARVDAASQLTWRVAPNLSLSGLNPLLYTDMLGSLTISQTYSADSLVTDLTADQLRAATKPYPNAIAGRFRVLPKSVPARVLDLALQITASATTPYDKAKAIETYLRTHYTYSLDVPKPPEGRDVADYFLFDLSSGYCDYYATAMVVLARAAGLPARLVIGYSSGDYDRAHAEYIVRELNAHSWVEIYFTDIGWVEFEPTSNLPAFALNADQQAAPPAPAEHQLNTSLLTKRGYFVDRNYTPVKIAFALLLFAAAAFYLRSQGILEQHASVASIYAHVYEQGRAIYRDGPPSETPTQFAMNLARELRSTARWLRPAAEELNYLTSLYMRETFSPHAVSTNEQSRADKIWRRLFWRLLYLRGSRRLG